MAGETYLIVGGSAAGMAAAATISTTDPDGAVCVLSAEKDPPYFRPMIPFIINQRKDADAIFLEGQGPYGAGAIDLRLDTRARRIDPVQQAVVTVDDESFSYDRLLIATGSRPHVPDGIVGMEHDGVFALRTLDDARRAAVRAEQTRHAVMLGGGLLNLKAAFALLERSIAVTLVVRSPEVLSQLMEPRDAALIRRALDRAGLRIVTEAAATEITADMGGVSGVVLGTGEEMPCQMVFIGKGVRPNTEWIESDVADIDGGVVVDPYTRAKAPNVFAAGDVAVTFDPATGNPMMTGLWTNAVEMGRCAGVNMAGRPIAYGGTLGILNATQVADIPFVAMGKVHSAGTDFEVHVRTSSDAYRKLVFTPDGNRLAGAVFVGNIANAGIYRAMIRDQRPVGAIKSELIDQTVHYGHLMTATH